MLSMENENKNNAAEQNNENAQQQKKRSFPVKTVAVTAAVTAAVVDGIIRKDKSVAVVVTKKAVSGIKGLVGNFFKKEETPNVEVLTPACGGNPCPYQQQNNNNQGRNNGGFNNNNRH